MKSSRKAPIQLALIALIAMVSVSGAVQLAATGTNTAIGNAWAEGDVFATEAQGGADEGELYAGLWAHAFVPAGTEGTNSAESCRTVPARTERRTFTNPEAGGHTYDIQSSYGDTTAIAKASKTGSLGLAEAFSEGSSECSVEDEAGADPAGYIDGRSQLVAFITHSGTGTANASASGSADYSALISKGEFGAEGSVSGSAAVNAANNCGGSVTGTAWKESRSETSDHSTLSDVHDYLSLSSGRNALSAKSTIDGAVSGQTSGSGYYALTSKGIFGNSDSRTSGDLSSTATTYKLGDSIAPGVLTQMISVYWPGKSTMLDEEAGDVRRTSLPASETLWVRNGPGTYLASSYLSSYSSASGYDDQSESRTYTDAFISAGVTRTLADAVQAYGASFIDRGSVSAAADTASAPGKSPITLASAGADTIFMGSGAHLVSRLTGADPASTADLAIYASDEATAGASPSSSGSVSITGYANQDFDNMAVKTVGPSYSPSGTSSDATGSYMTASSIDGTAVHTTDAAFKSPSALIADDISEINIWSWIEGSDPRTHAESAYGVSPYMSTPAYTSSPAAIATGVTGGPRATATADAVSRSVGTVFSSTIDY